MKPDYVNKPPHYTSDKVECIDAMEMAFGAKAVEHYCLGNVFKYLWRADMKGGEEDLHKAQWYMNRYKKLLNQEADLVWQEVPAPEDEVYGYTD